MTANLIRSRLLALFAGVALVVPTTALLLTSWGWDASRVGVVISLMTALAVATAPVWGMLDDHRAGLGMRGATGISTVGCAVLWLLAETGSVGALLVTPLLLIVGASSGGIEPLISARLQRLRLVGRYPGYRLFGSGGWVLGLGIASALTLAGSPHLVYLCAAMFFGFLLVADLSTGPVAARRRWFSWRVAPRILVFVALGLPVPVSAYVYLIYSNSALQTLGLGDGWLPYAALIALGLLELPAFWAVQRVIPNQPVFPLYAMTLAALAGSWLILLFAGTNLLLQIFALITHTCATSLWAALQVNVVKHYADDSTAGWSQASAAALSKALSALVSGLVVGGVIASFGITAAAWFIVGLCASALVGLLVARLRFHAAPLPRVASPETPTIETPTTER